MSDAWEAWLYGADRYERNTRAAVEEARAESARAQSRLAAQMRKQQGNLQGQIDRLTEAFVALVEYEDVRGELNEHADAAAWRKYARHVVPTIVVTGGAGLGDVPAPPDVHDYWLAWAVRGLVAEVGGAGGEGAALIEKAAQLDPKRTATLLVLIDAIRREARFGAGMYDVTLPAAPAVTRAERALWVATAEGRLGAGAVDALAERLAGLLGTPDAGRLEQWVRELGPTNTKESPVVRAAGALTALATLVEADLPEVAPTAPAGDRGVDAPEDPLASAVQSLVDQGAPGETAVIERMREIRSRMGFVADDYAATAWDAPAGEVFDLLLRDLAGTSAGPRDLAVRLLGPSLPPIVEALRREAVAPPSPRSVRLFGADVVTVSLDGSVAGGWRTALEERLSAQEQHSPVLLPAGIAAVVVGLLGLGLVAVDANWILLALAGLITGTTMLVRDRIARRAMSQARENNLARADIEVKRAIETTTQERAISQTHATDAEETAHRLERRFATPG